MKITLYPQYKLKKLVNKNIIVNKNYLYSNTMNLCGITEFLVKKLSALQMLIFYLSYT